jgi:NAD(P)-dependent dehydrogenase (short-subunit alcohol dehydrogenase family)
MRNEIDLRGRVAVVTGGGCGIGRATAIELARAGAVVVIVDCTAPEVKQTAAQICQEGGHAFAFTADVSDWSAMQRLAEKIKYSIGPVEIVVANASILNAVGDTWKIQPAEWGLNLAVNLMGAFHTVRAFLPGMVTHNRGVLIFVSSGAASHPSPGWSAYGAAKAGLDHLAQDLAAEIDQHALPIRVHTFYPGIVDTAMQQQIREMSRDTFPLVDKYLEYYKQDRLRAPEEPATVIRWLATPLAADLHGATTNIDDPVIRKRVAANLGIPPFKGWA